MSWLNALAAFADKAKKTASKGEQCDVDNPKALLNISRVKKMAKKHP
jgi:hypothetical protein